MRSEAEMIKRIKDIALRDEKIRAAYIEGSRVNPNVPRDIFQDYDVVYIVTSTKPYREDKKWITRFGEILYMHYPEDNVFYPSDIENCYGWQVQFTDGNRLDLHVCTKEYVLARLELYRILVDKDNCIPLPTEMTDKRYWVKKPSEIEFQCTCSEFWWCLNNVAKGQWRGEIPYVMDMINFVLRPQLTRVLAWKIGMKNKFSVSIGKSGKYIKNYLSEEDYQKFLETYPVADVEAIWNSVFVMCSLFRDTTEELGRKLNFTYDVENAENSLLFLWHVRGLPANAQEIYP